jgi:DNA ligase (NAD+)
MKTLEEQIRKHNHAYWVLNEPTISDAEYDALVEQLPEGHELRNYVSTQTEMLSLQKAYSVADVIKWCKSVARTKDEKFLLNSKFDGIAAELTLFPKLGSKLMTRGGEDITKHLGIIRMGMVGADKMTTTPTLRGEIVVTKSDFNQRLTGFKNQRQAVAGLLNAKYCHSEELAGVLLFIPHHFLQVSMTYDELEALLMMPDYVAKLNPEIPIDGLVIRLEDEEYGESLGATSHHPNHSIAMKFKNPSAQTKILDVAWQVSKTKITPVAILEPVELSGTTISRATLHNLSQFADFAPAPGATVIIERAGDVIPYVAQILQDSKQPAFLYPTQCPACGEPTSVSRTGVDLQCDNPDCGGAQASVLRDALVRLDIETIGPSIASDLVKLGYKTVTRVLGMGKGDWLRVSGFAEASATKMLHNIENRLRTPIEDWRLLAAMNLDGIGKTLSKQILQHCKLDDLPSAIPIPGIGPGRLNVLLGLNVPQLRALTLMFTEVIPSGKQKDQKTVCFTGADATPRGTWFSLAKQKGFSPVNAVTKTLSLLVTSDVESGSSKMKKAKAYNIEVMNYEDFYNL